MKCSAVSDASLLLWQFVKQQNLQPWVIIHSAFISNQNGINSRFRENTKFNIKISISIVCITYILSTFYLYMSTLVYNICCLLYIVFLLKTFTLWRQIELFERFHLYFDLVFLFFTFNKWNNCLLLHFIMVFGEKHIWVSSTWSSFNHQSFN